MIQRNNNLSVLPFYTSIDEQLHRRSYAYGDVYPLYTPVGYVPPFQIVVPHQNPMTISNAQLYRANGQYIGSILSQLSAGGLTRKDFPGYDVIVYPGTAAGGIPSEGQFYIVITQANGAKFYSDIFTSVGQIDAFLKIEWWDLQDFIMDTGRIVYDLGNDNLFKNTLYLSTQLGKPEYEFNEEGENRDGYFFPEKQISQKKFKCVFLGSEYLCDVMRFIRLSDFVKITDRYGHVYRADTFLITPKWEQQGNVASVELEFTCDTVAKKIPQSLSIVGDYNIDYSNDFFND